MANKNLEKIEEVDGVKYKFVFPNMGESAEADMEYSKGYTKALQNGLWPRTKMERHVSENGLWTGEDSEKVEVKNRQFQELVGQAFVAKDPAVKAELLAKLNDVRNELMSLMIQKQSLFNNTAEAKGEETKILSLIPKCVLNEDGSRKWNNYEEFQKEKDTQNTLELVKVFVAFISDLDNKLSQVDNLLNSYPEDEKVEEEILAAEKVEEQVKIEEIPAEEKAKETDLQTA